MISKDCTITIDKGNASVDEDVYLYKNDMNIQILFTIVNNKYRYTKNTAIDNIIANNKASYAQVKFKKGDIEIDFEEQETKDGAVVLLIKKELIDEDTELGDYSIQIRLFDENKTSVITLPPVENCIHIQRPLFEKAGEDTNIVDQALTDMAVVTYAEPISATNSDGTYNKKTWISKEKITTAELNRMEEGISDVSTQCKDIANEDLVIGEDGKLYIKQGNGTKKGVGVEIPTGGTVDLSNYVEKVEGKGLSTNDYTTAEKNKLAKLSETGFTDEQLSTALQSKIDDGSLGSLSIGDNSISYLKLDGGVSDFIIDKIKNEVRNDLYYNLFPIERYNWINKSITPSTGVLTDRTYNNIISMENYINSDDILNEFSSCKDENDEMFIYVVSDGTYSFRISMNDSEGTYYCTPSKTYDQWNNYGEYYFNIPVGSNFNIAIKKVSGNITNINDVFKHIKFYLSRKFEDIEYNRNLGFNNSNTLLKMFVVDKTKNNYVDFKIKPNITYFIKTKGLLKDVLNGIVTLSNVSISLFNKMGLQIYNGNIGNTATNFFSGIFQEDNSPNGEWVYCFKTTDESACSVHLSVDITKTATFDFKQYEITDDLGKKTYKEYDYLLNSIERIKQINPKYKNFKGIYNRNNDGLGATLNEKNYPGNYKLLNNVFMRNDYIENGTKGDFYFYLHDTPKIITNTVAKKGDIIYFDGENLFAENNPLWKYDNALCFNRQEKYDVCIIGGGSGGIGTAFALKDKGLKVCLVEKLDCLGGTNTNGGCPSQLGSPVGTWYKNIMYEAFINNGMRFTANSGGLKQKGTDDDTYFDKLWNASIGNSSKSNQGNLITVNPWYFYDYYDKTLGETIDIKYNREVINCFEQNGKIISATFKNLITGGTEIIYADYFVDSTANIDLLRFKGIEGTDYFIGSDAKETYNESVIADGTIANKYDINTIEIGYMATSQYSGSISGGIERDFKYCTYKEDETKYPTVDGVDNKGWTNNVANIPMWLPGVKNAFPSSNDPVPYDTFCKIISTTRYSAVNSDDYIDYGYDYLYMKSLDNAKCHYKYWNNGGTNMYIAPMKMLGFRESYRANCEYMVTQSDVETTITLDNYADKNIIALSSWYADSHQIQQNINFSSINNTFMNGIPYNALIPKKYTNVLVACRGFGASHIGQSCMRLIKTILSIGYATGIALNDVISNNKGDVRNADVSVIQNDCEIEQLIKDMNKYIFAYNVTKKLTNCTISNTLNVISYNNSYTTTIIANEGCTISTVTVTMGGTDVTSTVYSNGEINIPNVTGDIIITANATQNS